MLTRLELKGFKCFDRLILDLCPLTLLSGLNSSGKSSVLQALALLHQTVYEHESSSRLVLNGSSVRLGTVRDVLNANRRREVEIAISANTDSGISTCEWQFVGEREDMSMSVEHIKINDVRQDSSGALRYLLPTLHGAVHPIANCLRNITYITADRVGPRETYTLGDPHTTKSVGPKGEHTVSVLHWGTEDEVSPRLALKNIHRTRLRQVEGRMEALFPGCRVQLQRVGDGNAVALRLGTSRTGDRHSPVHVGFGLTQVLPIVVAALSEREDGIMLIENPEVHLHPAGQALMGQFLAEVASAGIQVIMETHSDHVLNGVRRAVKSKRLGSSKCAIYFFRPELGEQAEGPRVDQPSLDDDGNIDSWPDGFFDQFDIDMRYFAGWS